MTLLSYWRRCARLWPKLVVGIYIASYLVATYNHLIPALRHGLSAYSSANADVPLWLNHYWTSLVVLDPLAILLLMLHVRVGLLAYLLVILSDVIINFSFCVGTYGAESLLNLFQLGQGGFLLFFLATAPALWRLSGDISGAAFTP